MPMMDLKKVNAAARLSMSDSPPRRRHMCCKVYTMKDWLLLYKTLQEA